MPIKAIQVICMDGNNVKKDEDGHSLVGYIALLRQLNFICKGWVGDCYSDPSIRSFREDLVRAPIIPREPVSPTAEVN